MKNYYIIFILLCSWLLPAGCSDAAEDYKELDELEIGLDRSFYTCALGDMLEIRPEISGTVPEDELVFDWEVGHGEGYGDHAKFSSVAQMRNLGMKCELSPLFPAPGTYTMRIHARHPADGREFYSPHFKLKITGQTGLMALYETGGQSDIALIRNFTDRDAGYVIDNYYSAANDDRMIPGSGKMLTQMQGGETSFFNYHSIIAVTDETSVGADYITMAEIPGGWDKLLFRGGFNRSKPENIVFASADPMYRYQEVYIVDGGEIYGRQSSEYVLRPAIGTSANAYIDAYDIAPYVYPSYGSTYNVWLFDKKSRGFVGITNIISVFMNGAADPGSVVKVFTPGGKFNPSRMRADLVYMAEGGENGHLLAVMKKDDGQMFVAEINTIPAEPSGTAQALYDIDDKLPEGIIGYDFSSHAPSRQCCYFYTRNEIYRFSVDGQGTAVSPEPLGGIFSLQHGEEITSLRTLSSAGDNLMLVATWNGTQAKIYCYAYDSATGALARLVSAWPIPGKVSVMHLKHI